MDILLYASADEDMQKAAFIIRDNDMIDECYTSMCIMPVFPMIWYANGQKSGWRIQLTGREDRMLANWALAKRRSLFEEIFGVMDNQ